MRVLRTPEDRFNDLPGFPREPRYVDVPDGDGSTLRMVYVADGPEAVLLHGEPSWSYLYRKVLPVLAAAGFRAIAPDLVGFGRSDKPAETSDTATPGTSSGCARWPSTGSTCAGSRSSARTGAGGSACGWPPSTRTGSPRWWRPTPGCQPAITTCRRSGGTSAARWRRPTPSTWADSCRAAASASWAGPSARPTTPRSRTSPTRQAAGHAAARADRAGRSGDREPTGRRGRSWPAGPSRSRARSPRATPSPVPWHRSCRKTVPGVAEQDHPTIGNAGQFLQKDGGEELARAVVRFRS